MDNNGIDISNISSAKLTREQVKARFSNDPRLEKILTIFDKVDALDEKFAAKYEGLGQTGVLSGFDLSEMMGFSFNDEYASLDNSHDKNVSE